MGIEEFQWFFPQEEYPARFLKDIHDNEPHLPIIYDANDYYNNKLQTFTETALMQMQATFLLINIDNNFDNNVDRCDNGVFKYV